MKKTISIAALAPVFIALYLTFPIWGGLAMLYFALRGIDWQEELEKEQSNI